MYGSCKQGVYACAITQMQDSANDHQIVEMVNLHSIRTMEEPPVGWVLLHDPLSAVAASFKGSI